MSSTSTSPTTTPRLRPGQAEALRRWADALRHGSRNELVVVPVGYGKTVIGVGSFDVACSLAGAETCLYLTPTDVLRTQVYGGVAQALHVLGSARTVGKVLAENAAPNRMLTPQVNFVVATYQQLAAAPRVYEQLCRARKVHIVCDEAHHLGERGTWAHALASLPARSTLLLSATPVRLDREPIANARYVEAEEGLVIDPLVMVSMRQAWTERRILKHLNLQMKDYAVQLQSSAGSVYEFTASEMAELPDFDQRCVREQLRWNEDYVQPLIREFALALLAKLNNAPGRHQGLVFAATTGHADHLARLFRRFHPELRCVVVHSNEMGDAETDRRMRDFHERRYDVLIQVKKASEGFDAPTVSVLLKLDAIFSRGPVIQQLGRGLRYNHDLPESQNLLNVFIGRDPRLGAIIEHLERELPPASIERLSAGAEPDSANPEEEDLWDDEPDAEDDERPEILDVVEAGDVHLNHEGRYVDGQQLTMFGVESPRPAIALSGAETQVAAAQVIDIAHEMQESVEYCRTWTNRAARERAKRAGRGENAHAALNLAYAKVTGRRGALSTPAEYRAKGDWMKQKYMELLG
jgi:superfamily II DNA or RNA helicase